MNHRKTDYGRAVKAAQHTEWPTLWLIGAMYLVYAIITYFYAYLPGWILIPVAAYTLALYGSLQHEILHGHPTRWQWLNEALLFPSLNVWLPYALYKETHLKHHNNRHLTDPRRDPESYYLLQQRWYSLSKCLQAYYRFYNTFAGRLLWGPFHLVITLAYAEGRAIISGDRHKLWVWAVHGASCSLVLSWALIICGIPLWVYLLGYVYPSIALSLVRSFPEHRAAEEPEHRSVIVESGWLMSLLFLNNNLHAVHHRYPGLAWYQVPAVWQQQRGEILHRNNGYYFSGYTEVITRYWRRGRESVCYPLPIKIQ